MKIAAILLLLFVAAVAWVEGRPQEARSDAPDGYFQYVNVPAHKEYEFGWNRGNPHHYISRYEQAKDHRFRTRVSTIKSRFNEWPPSAHFDFLN